MVTWESTHGEVGLDVIAYVENILGITFPKDYVECARINNGGYPSLEAFDFESREEAVFNRLLSFHPDKKIILLMCTTGYVTDCLKEFTLLPTILLETTSVLIIERTKRTRLSCFGITKSHMITQKKRSFPCVTPSQSCFLNYTINSRNCKSEEN